MFGVGSCANEVESLVSFVSRSSPSIQVMIPCSNTARSCLLVMYFSKLFGICRIKDLLYIFIFVGWNCSMLFGWMNAMWVTTDSIGVVLDTCVDEVEGSVSFVSRSSSSPQMKIPCSNTARD